MTKPSPLTVAIRPVSEKEGRASTVSPEPHRTRQISVIPREAAIFRAVIISRDRISSAQTPKYPSSEQLVRP